MCWDCSLVNEEQQIYVEKSEDVHGLFWSCQTCIVNKVDVLTELKKIKERTSKEKLAKYVQNMHIDRNVNMVKPVNLYIKQSVKYM